MSETITGSCFCGEVAFTVELPTQFCGHCHCTMCRRAHGAGYVTWFAIPLERFELEKGQESLRRFRSSDHGTRSFCAECGSSLFCESTHHPGTIDVVLANMHAPIDRAPEAHWYYSDRVDWYEVDKTLPRFGGEKGNEPLGD